MPTAPSKSDVLIYLIEQGLIARLMLDARREGVQVPERFLTSPHLVLEIGRNMNPPIPDLSIQEDGVHCTLSFNRAPFACVLPWTAIWALVSKRDGRGYEWPEDMPQEAKGRMASPPALLLPVRPAGLSGLTKPPLPAPAAAGVVTKGRVVPFGPGADADSEAPRARPSHLRVVK